MVGRYYPFFLNNGSLIASHYLYAIDSPCLNPETGNPTFTLKKISERTNRGDKKGCGMDILNFCYNSPHFNASKKAGDIIKDLMRKRNPKVIKNGNDFPLIEIQHPILQKSLVINLRGQLKNKHYRFAPGRYVDILWTPTEFVVFKLMGNKQTGVNLEPVAAYKNYDVGFLSPLPVNLGNLEYKRDKFMLGPDNRSMALSLAIKELEWQSFDRPEFVKE